MTDEPKPIEDLDPLFRVREHNVRLLTENARLREALAYYADIANYSGLPGHNVFHDQGRCARGALAAAPIEAPAHD